MNRVTVNLEPDVDTFAISRVRRMFNELGPGEEITITIESAAAHQADPVIELIEKIPSPGF